MKRLIYVLILILLLTACGTTSELEQTEPIISEVESVAEAAETAVPPTDVPPTDVPPADVPPTDVPPTDVPPTDVPPTDVPPTDVPPTDVPPTDVPPTDVPPTDMPPTDVPPPTANSSLPTWQTSPMVDVKTGQTFTFADYAGETVFVEPFATWCGTCKNQLLNVMNGMNAVHSGGNKNVNYVILNVETNLANEQLAQYADAQGFPFQFAVATPELLRLLVDEFGSAVTSAPSTPHFIIRPDGTTTELATGLESAEEIADELLSIQ